MTGSGEEYIRGLRDSRTVLLNGQRVADVTTHPAFAGVLKLSP
jgi:4-hydroxyphenylacetate 3-monooxygenase